jgi:hypothetical protein
MTMKIEDLVTQLPEDLVVVRRDALRELVKAAMLLDEVCDTVDAEELEAVDPLDEKGIDDRMEALVVTL